MGTSIELSNRLGVLGILTATELTAGALVYRIQHVILTTVLRNSRGAMLETHELWAALLAVRSSIDSKSSERPSSIASKPWVINYL